MDDLSDVLTSLPVEMETNETDETPKAESSIDKKATQVHAKRKSPTSLLRDKVPRHSKPLHRRVHANTSAVTNHKVKRKPPISGLKTVSLASLMEEIALIYGFFPLPYDWLPFKSSYPKTSKFTPESIIQAAAEAAAFREESNDLRIREKIALYTGILHGHLGQLKSPICPGGKAWLRVMADQLTTEEALTDKRLFYAPSIAKNEDFDVSRFLAHRAVREMSPYSRAHTAMEHFAYKNTIIRWYHKGELKQGIRAPLDNKGDTSCIPYSIISSLRNTHPPDFNDLNNEVTGLRMSVAEYTLSAYDCDPSFTEFFFARRHCVSL